MKLVEKILRRLKTKRARWFPTPKMLYRTPFGYSIYLNLTKDVDFYFYLGLFETPTLYFIQKILRQGDVFVDVGANIGIYSLLASKKIGNEGKVHAFEPSDWPYGRLQENVALNACPNINVYKEVVSDSVAEVPFYICDDDAYNSIGNTPMQPVKEKRIVVTTTLEKFFQAQKLQKISILKIDTEGADYLVLKGAGTLLDGEHSPVIFCEYNRNIRHGYSHTVDEYYRFLLGKGYGVYELIDGKLNLFSPKDSTSSEIICLKSSHLISNNLRIGQ